MQNSKKMKRQQHTSRGSSTCGTEDEFRRFMDKNGLGFFSDPLVELGVDAVSDLCDPDLVGDDELRQAGLTMHDIGILQQALATYQDTMPMPHLSSLSIAAEYGIDDDLDNESCPYSVSTPEMSTRTSKSSLPEDEHFGYMERSPSDVPHAKATSSPTSSPLSSPVSPEMSSSQFQVRDFLRRAGLGHFSQTLFRLGVEELADLVGEELVNRNTLVRAGLSDRDLALFEEAVGSVQLERGPLDREAEEEGEEEEVEVEYRRDMRLSRRLSVGDLGREEAADLLDKALAELGIHQRPRRKDAAAASSGGRQQKGPFHKEEEEEEEEEATNMAVGAETSELRQAGLAALQAVMEDSEDEEAGWAPQSEELEVGLASRLNFLRWAKFDAHKARERRMRYWQTRADLFSQSQHTTTTRKPPPATTTTPTRTPTMWSTPIAQAATATVAEAAAAATAEITTAETTNGSGGGAAAVGRGEEKGRGFLTRHDPRLEAALRSGFCQVPLGCRDVLGRQVVLLKLGRLNSLREAEDDKTTPNTTDLKAANNVDLCRAVWYMLHVAFEEVPLGPVPRGNDDDADAGDADDDTPEQRPHNDAKDAAAAAGAASASLTQRLGIILLLDLKGATRQHLLSAEVAQLASRFLRGCLAVRVAAVRVFHQPWFFGLAWVAAGPLLLREKLRRRVCVLGGEDPGALRVWMPGRLDTPVDVDLEGGFGWDHGVWLTERLALENHDRQPGAGLLTRREK